jgi:acyl-CoA synthetase (NDP forming)
MKRKDVVAFMMSGTNTVEIRTQHDRFVPVYMFPEDAMQAFYHSYIYSRYRTLKEGVVPVFPDIDEERARKYLEPSGILKEGGWLPPETALGLVREYGIPIAETRKACTAEEAAKMALEIGFPVVLKLRSTTITHKTEVGGVLIGLESEDEVRQAFGKMKAQLESAGQGDEMEGVILQPVVKGGQEVILGMSFDPVFGPLVMVGIGGIYVELIKDVAFSIHPLTDIDPDYMFSQLKGLPLLQGWRGSRPKDIGSLREVLLRFSALIEDIPEIAAVEINPLMVFEEGKGTMAVDARILFYPFIA